MAFNYNRAVGFIDIVVRDISGLKLQTFRVQQGDKKTEQMVLNVLRKKYDYFNKEKSDLDWIRKA